MESPKAACDSAQMTVSLPGVFENMSKTGNSSVIPFIGDQTVPVLRKLPLTVNCKWSMAKKAALLRGKSQGEFQITHLPIRADAGSIINGLVVEVQHVRDKARNENGW